jgi:AmmeMemoRadiSam system protein B
MIDMPIAESAALEDPRMSLGPAVAGLWYPANERELATEVDALLAAASGAAGVRPRALVVPHAGYAYSGAVAARAFAAVRGASPARVILIGPSHHHAFSGAVVPRAARYRTPLGEVPIDVEAVLEIGGAPSLAVDDGPFAREHCLEAEIPFLQRALAPGWRLVPVLVGARTSPAVSAAVAEALRTVLDHDTLVVTSSDFTHYGPRFDYVPFRTDVDRRIESLGRGAIDHVHAGAVLGVEA